MLGQYLQQKMQQKLTPLQIQTIRLLEAPSIELEERIRKEIEENPALEDGRQNDEETDFGADEKEFLEKNEDNDFSETDYFSDDDEIPDYRLGIASNYSQEGVREDIPVAMGVSFHEHLINQLGLQLLIENDRQLAEYIIGNINDDGYLQRSAEEMCDDLLFQTGKHAAPRKIEEILSIIQTFDPAGVGARNLQECLLIQIKRKMENGELKIEYDNQFSILNSYFDDFSKKHYEKIMAKLNISEETLKKAIHEITKLNPKPGSAWGDIWEKSMSEITPDFILDNVDSELVLSLNNGNMPELRINRTYAEMLQDYSRNKKQSQEMKDAVVFVKQKLDSAKWFIEAVRQRQKTMLNTMNAIIRRQKDYFLTGDESLLRPMIMKDIAEATGYDISTISRVSNSKYIETDFGIFPLKHFFTEAAQTENGEEVSTREIKNILADSISHEDKKHPFADDALAAILKKKGFIVARRTVAKYREQMNIPVARLRKEI